MVSWFGKLRAGNEAARLEQAKLLASPEEKKLASQLKYLRDQTDPASADMGLQHEKLEKINTMRAERGQAELDFAAFDKEYEDVAAAI